MTRQASHRGGECTRRHARQNMLCEPVVVKGLLDTRCSLHKRKPVVTMLVALTSFLQP